LALGLFSSLIHSFQSRWGSRSSSVPFPRTRESSSSLVQRILFLALLFASELIILSVWLDSDSLVHRAGLIGIIHDWGSWILRCIIGFAAIFVTFAFLKNKTALAGISGRIAHTPIRWSLLPAHCFAMGVFVSLSFLLYGGGEFGSWANLLAAGWFVAGISAIAFAALAFVPWVGWVQLIRSTGHLWAYASTAVVSACLVGERVQWLWQPASHLTFRLSKIFLSPFVSDLIANPTTMVIGTQRFQVEIAPECSGLEGVGLILAFGILWLLVFREECRFPQSLLLIPLGVTLVFLLNAVRIAALVLIGNAGAEQIAFGGFHSQAGWIGFSTVSVGFCLVIQRVPWFTTSQQSRQSLGTATHNPTAAFLSPFLVILATGMIAGAANGAGSLEWLYPLRFFAALGMLWVFRRSYASLSWRCDWLAPAIGALVFVMWVALDRFSNPTADREISAALMASSTLARVTWITFRVLAAVVTVPVAEELAFRGFLMRRLLSQDFESVSLRRFSWFALLVSSVTCGILHGGYWIAGSVAGILFGLAVIRGGRIGEAVVAHATANALLAAYVLAYHRWHLW
jgi:exosortase E/protease (VPEID-CTERM system)